MADKSTHPTVIEYGVREMMKKKSPRAAAGATAKKLHGYQNMLLGGDVTEINPAVLEEALWDRLVDFAIAGVAKVKPGYEHYALDGTVQHFNQTKKVRVELKRRALARLGCNPFSNDTDDSCPV
jgi:hypothetical protein